MKVLAEAGTSSFPRRLTLTPIRQGSPEPLKILNLLAAR